MFVHPDYNWRTGRNDLSIIELKGRFPSDDFIHKTTLKNAVIPSFPNGSSFLKSSALFICPVLKIEWLFRHSLIGPRAAQND